MTLLHNAPQTITPSGRTRTQRVDAKRCAILMSVATACTPVCAEGIDLKFSGFGTLAAVHSSDNNSDFVSTRSQPSGAGHTSAWSLAPDSKLGGQVNAVFGEKLSAVLQVVSQHQYDNSFTPQVEWANLKYQVAPEFAVRAGRIAAPSYLLSESRFVGYANTWVRPPPEVYSVLPITSNDGVDATYRVQVDGVNNTVQAFYGTSTFKIDRTTEAKSTASWGFNDTVEFGAFTLRAGYNSFKVDLESSALNVLFDGLNQFSAGAAAVPVAPFQSAAAQAAALAGKYDRTGMNLSAVALGATYDPGDWFVTSEWVGFKGDALLTDSVSWYASGGYRFGKLTPYLMYAATKAIIKSEAGIVSAPAPLGAAAAALNGALNTAITTINPTQKTVSLGLRWDFISGVALKTQYDRIRLGESSIGRLSAVPGFTPARQVNVVTASIDFVF